MRTVSACALCALLTGFASPAISVPPLRLIGDEPVQADARPVFPMPGPAACRTRSVMVEQLTGKHGERQRDWKLGASGILWEFWASDKGSWTLVSTTPLGRSCVVAAGQGAHVAPRVKRLGA